MSIEVLALQSVKSLTAAANVRRVTLLLCVTFMGAEQTGCSGTPTSASDGGSSGVGGTSSAGNSSTGGAQAIGGSKTSGGAGSSTGGRAATGGSTNAGGNGGAGGICASNCTVQSGGPFCGTSAPVTLVCMGPFPSNLFAIMTANGCTDAGTDAIRYCCPSLILTQCQ